MKDLIIGFALATIPFGLFTGLWGTAFIIGGYFIAGMAVGEHMTLNKKEDDK